MLSDDRGRDRHALLRALLSERLAMLARDSEAAGFPVVSEHLLYLALELLDAPETLIQGTRPQPRPPGDRQPWLPGGRGS